MDKDLHIVYFVIDTVAVGLCLNKLAEYD